MDLMGAGNNSLTRKKLILNIHCSQCTSTIAGSGCLVHSWITGPGRHGRRKPPALINKAGTFYSSANESSRSVLLQFWKRGGKAWQTTSQHTRKSVHSWACSEVEEEEKKIIIHHPPTCASIRHGSCARKGCCSNEREALKHLHCSGLSCVTEM